MDLVKNKKIYVSIIISLVIGFLSGCEVTLPTFLTKPDLYEIYSILDQYYYKDLDFKLEDVESVEALFERLDDPYTYMYVPNTRTIELDESYYGIGVTIIDDDLGLLVGNVNPLANLNGKVYIGDIITAINDTVLETLSYEEKTALLSGELNDEFNLTIQRGDQVTTTTVTISEIPINSVTSTVYENKIAYIDINRFAGKTGLAFRTELALVEAQNPTGLIIDVRDNGGGYLTAVVDIIAQFATGNEPVVTMHRIYDDHKTNYYGNPDNVKKTYPIVILMNEHSASASEVLAMALRENGSYPLLGTQSFGKFVYQTTFVLNRQGKEMYLNMTEGFWYSPNGNTVEGGIVPDVVIEQSGLLSRTYPVYMQEWILGDDMTEFQALIDVLNMTEDSLEDRFDVLTLDADLSTKISAYQTQFNLQVTGTLNYETTMHLIDAYRLYREQANYDLQLQQAIAWMVNDES
ncbi:S41 family peptidase [Paracholeplasma manati]|uniref:S41 family peptidase n=1 Tax=Paracholeplasma manati TaxID=591373 RepID=UPI002408745E|nr:S41 family peptidase [Paracholeplasma manati]MDG0887987.1 S41 family peptidase [Paracholeplasma manati]